MNIKSIISIAALTIVLASCKTTKIAYFQDVSQNHQITTMSVAHPVDIRIQPEDKLSIIVKSKDPRISALFNLQVITSNLGQGTGYMSNSYGISKYNVDKEGNIDFPIIGDIHVEGMTRHQVAEHIKNLLINKDYAKNPTVTVEFIDFKVSVMGEVSHPGRFVIEKDHVTLLDALSMAGDLTINGKRENVLVQREFKDGTRKFYRVNLTEATSLYNSPVFYLQQNDVVYVEPNKYRERQSTVNGNQLRSTSFWFSLASLLTTLGVILFK